MYADVYGATSNLLEENRVFKSKKGDVLRLHSDQVQSPLMERFLVRMKVRVPETKKQEPSFGGLSSVSHASEVQSWRAERGDT